MKSIPSENEKHYCDMTCEAYLRLWGWLPPKEPVEIGPDEETKAWAQPWKKVKR